MLRPPSAPYKRWASLPAGGLLHKTAAALGDKWQRIQRGDLASWSPTGLLHQTATTLGNKWHDKQWDDFVGPETSCLCSLSARDANIQKKQLDERNGDITVLYTVSAQESAANGAARKIHRMRIAPVYDWRPPRALRASSACLSWCSERGTNLGALVFFALRLAKRLAALVRADIAAFSMELGPARASSFRLYFQRRRHEPTDLVSSIQRHYSKFYGGADSEWKCDVTIDGDGELPPRHDIKDPFLSNGDPSGINPKAAAEIVALLQSHTHLRATEITSEEAVERSVGASTPEHLRLEVVFLVSDGLHRLSTRDLLVSFAGYQPLRGPGSVRREVPWYDSPQVPRPGEWNGPLSAEAEQLLPSTGTHSPPNDHGELQAEGGSWADSVRQRLREYGQRLSAAAP